MLLDILVYILKALVEVPRRETSKLPKQISRNVSNMGQGQQRSVMHNIGQLNNNINSFFSFPITHFQIR